MLDVNTPDLLGVYRNIESSVYHRWQAFSITTGLELLKSPGHYIHRLLNPIEPTPAMRLGTLLHMCVLEPHRFADTVLYVPSHIPQDRRTKQRKAWEEGVRDVFPEKVIIETEDARKIDGMYQSIMSRDVCRSLFDDPGEEELSLLWEDESGVKCKGRIDRYHKEAGLLIDIKTTTDASADTFSKTVCNRGYHIQAAHYAAGACKLGLPVNAVVLVAVETEEPYGVGVYELPKIAMDAGKLHREKLLDILQSCTVNDDWPTYPDEVQKLNFPAWAFNSIERALGYY